MFWNDPSLYSAHLPYKEFGQTPFVPPQFNLPPQFNVPPQLNLPWQNIPKFPPTPFGMLPYYDPKMFYTPFVQPQMFTPFIQPPYNVTPFNYYRPFIY